MACPLRPTLLAALTLTTPAWMTAAGACLAIPVRNPFLLQSPCKLRNPSSYTPELFKAPDASLKEEAGCDSAGYGCHAVSNRET